MPSENLKVRYGSKLHQRILDAIRSRHRLSRGRMSKRHAAWRKAEEQSLAYIPLNEEEALRRERREQGEHQQIKIVIPQSYAQLQTAVTYYTSVFLSRNPILQYSGRHGEPEMAVQAIDAIMDYQVQVGRMLIPFHVWLYDMALYGVGFLGIYWEEEEVTIERIVEKAEEYLGIEMPGATRKVRERLVMPGYQGNKCWNIRPYDAFPDPRVPIQRLQDMEFFITRCDATWHQIREGDYFNLDRARTTQAFASDRIYGSPEIELPAIGEHTDILEPDIQDVGVGQLREMYIDLVPSEWGLGSGKTLRKWVITDWEDRLVIGARPAGEYHNKFPIVVQEYEKNGYALFKRSMMEMLEPMQNLLDWLINTHMVNVRKCINDQWVVDPALVTMKDLTSSKEGKIIRLKPQAYAQGLKPSDVIQQLPVVDVTQGHVNDAKMVRDLMELMAGTSSNLMGQVNQGGRKTATEVRSANTMGINRLKADAEYASAMGWSDLAQILLSNTQQYYDAERMFRIAGDLWSLQAQQTHLVVTPEDIQGFFDFIPVDGTQPVDRFAQANLWREILMGMAKDPQLSMSYDRAGIFAWMAQLAGLKNIKQFRIQPQIMPDEQVAAQAQAGNVVPIGNPAEQDLGTPPEPGQVSGMGTT